MKANHFIPGVPDQGAPRAAIGSFPYPGHRTMAETASFGQPPHRHRRSRLALLVPPAKRRAERKAARHIRVRKAVTA